MGGMVDCYLGLSRQREAVTVATGACKHLANSSRALTLYATVLLKEPLSVARAKSLLERAAGTGHLPAVYLLAELLAKGGQEERAIQHYSQALALDPKNESALAGLQRMEAAQDGMESGYDMQDLEETASVGRGSPVQQELEDSETEAVWSDGDLNLVANGT